MKNKRKRLLFRIFAASFSMVLLILMAINVFVGNAAIFDYIEKNVSPIGAANVTVGVDDEDGVYTLTAKEAGHTFRILQISDIHFTCGFPSYSLDRHAVTAIATLVHAEQPDLIVLSGDSISPIATSGATLNTMRIAEAVAALMESFEIPWTLVFGNHDGEGLATRAELAQYFASTNLEYCLFRRGDENIDGEGNDYIKLLNADGTLSEVVFFMDSHAGGFVGYDHVHENQIAWYKDTVDALNAKHLDFRSIMFIHIPPLEYETMYQRYQSGDSDIVMLYGEIGETISEGKDLGFYDALCEMDTTEYVFFGHDHKNSAALYDKNDGIVLSYTPTIDYSAYPFAKFVIERRGGNRISVAANGDITVDQVYLDALAE